MITKCTKCGSTSFRATEWTIYDAEVDPKTAKLTIDTNRCRDNGTEDQVYCQGCSTEYNLSEFEEHEYV